MEKETSLLIFFFYDISYICCRCRCITLYLFSFIMGLFREFRSEGLHLVALMMMMPQACLLLTCFQCRCRCCPTKHHLLNTHMRLFAPLKCSIRALYFFLFIFADAVAVIFENSRFGECVRFAYARIYLVLLSLSFSLNGSNCCHSFSINFILLLLLLLLFTSLLFYFILFASLQWKQMRKEYI